MVDRAARLVRLTVASSVRTVAPLFQGRRVPSSPTPWVTSTTGVCVCVRARVRYRARAFTDTSLERLASGGGGGGAGAAARAAPARLTSSPREGGQVSDGGQAGRAGRQAALSPVSGRDGSSAPTLPPPTTPWPIRAMPAGPSGPGRLSRGRAGLEAGRARPLPPARRPPRCCPKSLAAATSGGRVCWGGWGGWGWWVGGGAPRFERTRCTERRSLKRGRPCKGGRKEDMERGRRKGDQSIQTERGTWRGGAKAGRKRPRRGCKEAFLQVQPAGDSAKRPGCEEAFLPLAVRPPPPFPTAVRLDRCQLLLCVRANIYVKMVAPWPFGRISDRRPAARAGRQPDPGRQVGWADDSDDGGTRMAATRMAAARPGS